MKVLVTGGGGQLVRSLLERAERHPSLDVVAVGRPTLDLAQPDAAAALIAERRPDVVVNAAAYTAVDAAEDEPDSARLINAEAPGRLAAATRAAGGRFVQVSTDYVFAGDRDRYDEDAPTGPRGVYGSTKLAGEQAVLAADPAAAVVRTAWVYGPFGRNFLRTMLTLAETRSELTVVGDQHGSPTCSLDLADGLLAMLTRWADGARDAGVFHLAGTGDASWAEFAAEIMVQAAANGLPSAAVRAITTAEYPTRAARPRSSRLDSDRFARSFGYRAPHWRESVSAVVRRLADQR